ncbi:MAG: TlpA disulfide reductase family protein [Ilumatobacteraceae bacterium]|nr:TlpA disulfide reductase family protein [Ilumatobacteraceae bacterium]
MCRAEAPDVEQFARAHADEVRVIGLGTQDSGGEAAEFVRDYLTYSFPMYWDETYESWSAFGITGQPAAVMLSADGEVVAEWRGVFPEDEVLALARG